MRADSRPDPIRDQPRLVSLITLAVTLAARSGLPRLTGFIVVGILAGPILHEAALPGER